MSETTQPLFREFHKAVAAANTARDSHIASGESHATRPEWIAAIEKLDATYAELRKSLV